MLGEDIHEGKRTLMVIHSCSQSPTTSHRLIEILNLRTKDPILITEAIQIINSTDSVDYAKQVSKQILKDSWMELN